MCYHTSDSLPRTTAQLTSLSIGCHPYSALIAAIPNFFNAAGADGGTSLALASGSATWSDSPASPLPSIASVGLGESATAAMFILVFQDLFGLKLHFWCWPYPLFEVFQLKRETGKVRDGG